MQKENDVIECFTYIYGEKEANSFIRYLMDIKVDKDTIFKIIDLRDNTSSDRFIIKGFVTEKDWEELHLEQDFMRA